MSSGTDEAETEERARVHRMRAQLVTVLACGATATASYFVACAVIW